MSDPHAGEPVEARSVEGPTAIPGARLVRDPVLVVLAMLPAVIAVVCGALGVTTQRLGLLWATPIVFLSVATLPAALARRSRSAGVLSVGATWLSWNGKRWLRRATIREATWRELAERGAIVHLATRRSEACVALPDVEGARSLVAQLGLGAGQRVARFRAESRMFDQTGLRRAVFVLLALSVPLGGGMAIARVPDLGWVVLAFLFFVAAFMFAHYIPTKVVIGADAVTLSWLGRVEVISFTDVRSVGALDALDALEETQNHLGFELRRADGTARRILVGTKDRDEAKRDRMVERIHEVLELHAASGATVDADAFRRKGRAAREWIRALRAAGAGADADMRHAPIAADRLWRTVQDAGAEGFTRAAAAVALAASASPAERVRIQIAAEASASPALRIALERSIDEHADEEAIAASLEALERTSRAGSTR